ncbi:MAG: helix-turn-helix transcriptional regulator [Roseburia sp.]|nr:helix-turn-helix transcriptional regulator [Roseburia sp.]
MKRTDTEFRVIQIKDKNIGSSIRKIREEQKIRQTDIVKQLQLRGVDISIYSYNRIEKGTQNPTVSCLIGLCDILKCDMNQIFFD